MYQLRKVAKFFFRRQEEWSIGIYSGDSPFNLKPHPQAVNPVLTARDVTDAKANFVADPFMIYEEGSWYMFFEVLDRRDGLGKIALATSRNGVTWSYCQIVLEEPFHLSYPYIFKWNNEYYLIPETYQTGSIRLYKAIDFPTRWVCAGILLDDRHYVDATIFRHEERWWMFSCAQAGNDTLYLHSSENLLGPWTEHPQSPLVKGDASIARPAGRILSMNGKLFRYSQDCQEIYGKQVNAFEINELTTTHYQEKKVPDNPILQPSKNSWRSIGMHTIDPHKIAENQWIACVDGKKKSLIFKLFEFSTL